MLIVKNSSTDAAFNLALEEVLLKEYNCDIFMLWQNFRAVVIGKNQNALEEIDSAFAKQNGVAVVRRITGGGAVFHDLGNLNFTFIKRQAKDKFLDFELFNKPIIQTLAEFGFNAVNSKRNDILVGDKKVSGNAQTVFKDSVMHHGTLLFNADMAMLSKVLKPHAFKIESKAIQSVRSRVANLSEIAKREIDIEQFKIAAEQKFQEGGGQIIDAQSDKELLSKAHKLKDQKYSLWEWNFGSSPKYKITKCGYFSAGLIEVTYEANGGKITSIKFYGDFSGICDISGLESKLIGAKIEKNSLINLLKSQNLQDYIKNIEAADLANLIVD